MSEGGSWDPKSDPEDAAFQLDAYGLKGKFRPAEINDSDPGTWRETGQRINLSLMSAADQVARLIADVPKEIRSLLKGLTAMPAALSSRVARAHKTADQREKKIQQSFIEGTLVPGSPEEVEDKLRAFILRKRAEGWCVVLEPHVDGGTLLAIVRPELEEYARFLASKSIERKTLPPHTEPHRGRPGRRKRRQRDS